jgi:predicted metal-dependent enzyme (double-stranded beta helix superfamily)
VAANHGNPVPARTEILASVRTLLKRPDLLDIGLHRPGVNADSTRILYYDPSVMIVLGYSAEAGRYDPPHNHGNWLVTGMYRGEVEYSDWRRLDEGSRPGYAEIERVTHCILKPGDVELTPPPPHDIHSNTMLTENYMLVVIGGGFASKRIYYDPAKKTYIEKTTA